MPQFKEFHTPPPFLCKGTFPISHCSPECFAHLMMMLPGAFSASVLQMRSAFGLGELFWGGGRGLKFCVRLYLLWKNRVPPRQSGFFAKKILLKLIVCSNQRDLWGEEEEERASLVNWQLL